MQPPSAPLIETWDGLMPYAEAIARMEAIVADVLTGAPERLIFCEHPPVLTVGSSGKITDITDAGNIPVIATGRGGQVTYHGPGQRVIYLVVRLERWGKDVRAYVRWLQEWLIAGLAELGVTALRLDEIGVWVETPKGLAKIAAIGIRVRKGVAYHGIALNVAPDLAVYQRFIPCGITDKGVTSLADVAASYGMAAVDAALIKALQQILPLRS
ncbi:MAG: lipoyl(octanoyl) transferase LipB [Proteobacteria bacterium]|nr:lipoyl(octanoyl) transferase LipB [Pseudomonadota bacterium]